MAGFTELLAIDFDEHAVKTFKENFKEVPVWNRDITKIKGNDILKFCNIKKGELDLLDGSPPCQGFSMANTTNRQARNQKNFLYKDYMRIVRELMPRVAVMENVKGITQKKMRGHFLNIVKSFDELGYTMKAKILNAKYYNVPQERERLIIIAVRRDLDKTPVFPKPNKNTIKLGEAIKNCSLDDMPINNSKYVKLAWEKCNIGEDFSSVLGASRGFSSYKLSPYSPCPTLTKRTTSLIHWKVPKELSLEMKKIVQSFPKDFIFNGSFSKASARIGNSAPPNMMKEIAAIIKKEILN
jgi:DNA (cytosine-5)-methyltransferase 1